MPIRPEPKAQNFKGLKFRGRGNSKLKFKLFFFGLQLIHRMNILWENTKRGRGFGSDSNGGEKNT